MDPLDFNTAIDSTPVNSSGSGSGSGMRAKKYLVILPIILLVTLILCAAVVFVLNDKNDDDNKSDTGITQDQDVADKDTNSNPVSSPENETMDSPDFETFEGAYLTAELPVGWTLVEYTDVAGMGASVEGTSVVDGLSGFEIFDEFTDSIYRVSGQSGVGGSAGCSELAVFVDTEQSYIDSIKEDNNLFIPPLELNIIDLSNAEYTEINLLGLRLRRLDNSLYLAKKEDVNAFNTTCGISTQYYIFDGLSYTIGDSGYEYDSDIYSAELNTDINLHEETLVKLDAVLNSIKVK